MSESAPQPTTTAERLWSAGFGLFLGLALLKFGNPVVLDARIPSIRSAAELMDQPWPLRWAFVGMGLLSAWGLPLLARRLRPALGRIPRWLWIPLLIWAVWQFMAASQSVDSTLTALTLFQVAGIVLAYAFGVTVLADPRLLRLTLAGVMLGLCLCLMRANTQKWVEFPADRAMLIEGERTGWTNFPPTALETMKTDGLIVQTNGTLLANPLILSKLERGRVHGTLVYPNALAGAVLLILPIGLFWVWSITREQRPAIRWAAFGLLAYLGFSALLWSGSKSGWLIALTMGVAALLWIEVPRRFKMGLLGAMVVGGLLVFGLRFQSYFAAGATSVGARFDYWRAAVQIARTNPGLGTGPGTFQRPYAQIKAPDAEMARLAHNDYLQQFSDSGLIGGAAYAMFIGSWLVLVGRWTWRQRDAGWLLLFLGVAGWWAQGMSEFSLYVPALAWTAFAFAGALSGVRGSGAKIGDANSANLPRRPNLRS